MSDASPQAGAPVAAPRFATLTLGSIGVVYGDIGTSPLYTLRAVFHAEHGLPLTEFNLLGIISLIFWALLLIVTL